MGLNYSFRTFGQSLKKISESFVLSLSKAYKNLLKVINGKGVMFT